MRLLLKDHVIEARGLGPSIVLPATVLVGGAPGAGPFHRTLKPFYITLPRRQKRLALWENYASEWYTVMILFLLRAVRPLESRWSAMVASTLLCLKTSWSSV